jgi:hypothetical protein
MIDYEAIDLFLNRSGFEVKQKNGPNTPVFYQAEATF